MVEDVVAERNGNGLSISPMTGIAGDHVIRDSVFRNNTVTGVFSGNGIFLIYPAEGITIERCSVTGNTVGIEADEISHGAPNTLADSVISNNAGDGLTSHDGSFAVVQNCTVSDNGGDGLEFAHGGAEVVGCHVEEPVAGGVHATDRGGSDIHGNWITGNGEGVTVGGDWPSDVRNNYFNNTDNEFFGQAAESMNYEKTAGRNIVGGPYFGGNLWANPNGTGFSQTHPDADRDGICDEACVVNPEEGITDHLPLAPAPGMPVVAPAPYGDHPVPGRIEAEDYDVGGEGVAYHDTSPGKTGGAYRHDDVDIETGNGVTNAGWIRNGEWLAYTAAVAQAGQYTLTARVASPNSGRTIDVSIDGTSAGTLTVPKTGSFTTWQTVSAPVTLGVG